MDRLGQSLRIILLTVMCFMGLTSCSLRSAYNNPVLRAQMACINIAGNYNTRYEVELNQHLDSILPADRCINDQQYSLSTNIRYSTSSLVISKESDIMRQQLNATVDYSLSKADSGEVLLSTSLIIVDSYNTFDMPYAAYAEERMLKTNLATQGAERIYHRLVSYFADLQAK